MKINFLVKQANLIYLVFYKKMMKFYCTTPNCKRSIYTERSLYYHDNRGRIYNPNESYKSYEEPPSSSSSRLLSNHGNKRRHDIPIPYEVSLISESERYKKLLVYRNCWPKAKENIALESTAYRQPLLRRRDTQIRKEEKETVFAKYGRATSSGLNTCMR